MPSYRVTKPFTYRAQPYAVGSIIQAEAHDASIAAGFRFGQIEPADKKDPSAVPGFRRSKAGKIEPMEEVPTGKPKPEPTTNLEGKALAAGDDETPRVPLRGPVPNLEAGNAEAARGRLAAALGTATPPVDGDPADDGIVDADRT